MIDPTFLENFGSGAGGGFLGVLLGWLINKQQMKELREDVAAKASQREVDLLKQATDDLVRDKTCLARTEGIIRTMIERIDGVNDKLASRIDGVTARIDNSSRRFDKLDGKLDRVLDLMIVPFEKRVERKE